MTTFPTARRQDLAAPFCFHTCAETMRLMATSHFGLKRAFRQKLAPLNPPKGVTAKSPPRRRSDKLRSVCDPLQRVKKIGGISTCARAVLGAERDNFKLHQLQSALGLPALTGGHASPRMKGRADSAGLGLPQTIRIFKNTDNF